MSEDGDLRSQWRGYADNGEGVSIGFEVESLKAIRKPSAGVANPSPSLEKIEYEIDRQKAKIEDNVDRIVDLWRRGAGHARTLLTEGTEERRKHAGNTHRRNEIGALPAIIRDLCF